MLAPLTLNQEGVNYIRINYVVFCLNILFFRPSSSLFKLYFFSIIKRQQLLNYFSRSSLRHSILTV